MTYNPSTVMILTFHKPGTGTWQTANIVERKCARRDR